MLEKGEEKLAINDVVMKTTIDRCVNLSVVPLNVPISHYLELRRKKMLLHNMQNFLNVHSVFRLDSGTLAFWYPDDSGYAESVD